MVKLATSHLPNLDQMKLVNHLLVKKTVIQKAKQLLQLQMRVKNKRG